MQKSGAVNKLRHHYYTGRTVVNAKFLGQIIWIYSNSLIFLDLYIIYFERNIILIFPTYDII